MREIKFRIWDCDTGEYVREGWHIGHKIYANRDIQSPDPFGEILEQYTGLKDKNGREIYEGDILQGADGLGSMGLVQYAYGHFGMNWDFKTNIDPMNREGRIYGAWGTRTNLRRIDDGFLDDFIIIGNIHENPELLK